MIARLIFASRDCSRKIITESALSCRQTNRPIATRPCLRSSPFRPAVRLPLGRARYILTCLDETTQVTDRVLFFFYFSVSPSTCNFVSLSRLSLPLSAFSVPLTPLAFCLFLSFLLRRPISCGFRSYLPIIEARIM